MGATMQRKERELMTPKATRDIQLAGIHADRLPSETVGSERRHCRDSRDDSDGEHECLHKLG